MAHTVPKRCDGLTAQNSARGTELPARPKTARRPWARHHMQPSHLN
jgi:hypothetical protein